MISLPDIERRLGIKFTNVDLHTELKNCRIVGEFTIEMLPCRFERTYYSLESRIDGHSCLDQFEKDLKETLKKLGLFKEQKCEDKPVLGWYRKRWSSIAQEYLEEVTLNKPSVDGIGGDAIPLVAK